MALGGLRGFFADVSDISEEQNEGTWDTRYPADDPEWQIPDLLVGIFRLLDLRSRHRLRG